MDFDEFTQRYVAAWKSGNPNEVADFYASGKGIIINRGEEQFGREAMVAMVAGFMSSYPDMEFTRDFFRIAGDHGVFGWTLKGRNMETENWVKISGWEEWNFDKDGQVTLSLGWFDAKDYDAQVAGQGA